MKSVTLHDIALYQRTSQCYVSCYGCHLRLHRRWRTHSQYLPDSRIAVAGAGSDPTDHPKVNNVFDAIFFYQIARRRSRCGLFDDSTENSEQQIYHEASWPPTITLKRSQRGQLDARLERRP